MNVHKDDLLVVLIWFVGILTISLRFIIANAPIKFAKVFF